MLKRRLGLTITMLSLIAVGCSRYGSIEGGVVDKLTGRPVSGATVNIKGTTFQTLTDEQGRFILRDVVPGAQRLVARKEGFISLGELEVTVGKGTITPLDNMYMVKRPPKLGLFLIGDEFTPIERVQEATLGTTGMNRILYGSGSQGVKEVTESINMILFEGESPVKSMPPVVIGTQFRWSPKCWITGDPVGEGIESRELVPGLWHIRGQLTPGRYLVVVRQAMGLEDSYYCFDVGPVPEWVRAEPHSETIRITCWAGYAEPFAEEFKQLIGEKLGVDLHILIYNPIDQDEFFLAAKSGTADLISLPGDLAKTPRFFMFKEGTLYLSEVDLNNIPNFQNLLPFFKEDQSLIHNAKRYGLPYNCGPYGLAYNRDVVKEAPASWNILWDPQYAGKYTISNNYPKCNLWITGLSLGYTYDQIFDITKMDRAKLQQKLNVLARNAKSLWDGSANPDEYPELALATDWGFAAAAANKKGGHWLIGGPKEGGTAWIDTWCITHTVKDGIKKRICEEWINFQLSPKAQVEVVRSQGVSPVVNNVASLVTPEEKKMFHVGDNDYFKTVAIWRVMREETEKAFGEMWEEAKKHRW